MSTSHNPGGTEYDWGIKFNYSSGQPPPESITEKIYGNTLSISEIKTVAIPDTDFSQLGVIKFWNFTVEVIDPVSDYLELLENVFYFQMVRDLLSQPDFSNMFQYYKGRLHTHTTILPQHSLVGKSALHNEDADADEHVPIMPQIRTINMFILDAMHAVTGAYAKPIFVDKLGASSDSISNGVPLEDFGHGHPDPNLTYAKDLVDLMYGTNAPDFGAASDGPCSIYAY